MRVTAKKKIRYPLALERLYAKEIVKHTESLMAIVRSYVPRMIRVLLSMNVAMDADEDASREEKAKARWFRRHFLETDAISSVVSEETGRLSIGVKGELFYNLSIDDVRMMLIDELKPKHDDDYLDEYEKEDDTYEESR